MAWFFNGPGDTRKRRRMGEVAKTSWQAKWEAFFSRRKSRRSVPADPPKTSRQKKPAAISAYDEPAATIRRGRALPRWRRVAQAALWKRSLPLRRIHRRVPPVFLVVFYLGLLTAISASLMLALLPDRSPAPQPPVVAEPGSQPMPPLSLTPSGAGGNAPKPFSLATDNQDLKSQMADIEFRAGRYDEAERLYRRLFKTSANKPFLGYRIYVCSLLRDQHGQAADLLERLARIGGETPALLYARATLAYEEGRPSDAEDLLAEAHTRYGNLCAEYNPTLQILGYAKTGAPPTPSE